MPDRLEPAPRPTADRRKRLVLHIGFHETQTMVLQESMFGSRVGLRRHGIVYPQPLSGHQSHLDLATALGFNPRLDELGEFNRQAVIERYRRLIEDCPEGSTIVISSEEFCQGNYRPFALENLQVFIDKLDVETIVVAYRRDPVRFLLAIYHHELRDTLSALRFGEWIDRFDLAGADFQRRLDPWRESIGRTAELRVRDYDAVRATGTPLLTDFLLTAGLGDIDMLSVEHPVSEIHPLLVEPLIAVRRADLDDEHRRRHLASLLEIGAMMAPVDAATVHLGVEGATELSDRLGCFPVAADNTAMRSEPRKEHSSMSTTETGSDQTRGDTRVSAFSRLEGNRYWWHRREECRYVPPIYSWLSNEEWELMLEWFHVSETEFGDGTGECGVPCLSMLQGLIMGNGVKRVVQLGHYLGYSTILISLMMQRMGAGGRLFSVDVDQRATDFTQGWVDRFGTSDGVTLRVADSSDPEAGRAAVNAFDGHGPELIFIDSSHQYEHTLKELDLWYPILQDWGFIVLHDASTFASNFDASSGGGVKRAIDEWNLMATDRIFTINAPFGNPQPGGSNGGPPATGEDLVYVDGCGLGLLQKAPR